MFWTSKSSNNKESCPTLWDRASDYYHYYYEDIIMAVKYLPVHKQMRKVIKGSMRVVHNGGGCRHGMSGHIISTLGGQVTVHFNKGFNQKYSWGWFLENFYIDIETILKMSGIFNGTGYVKKYKLFSVTHQNLVAKKHNTHAENKAIVDAENKAIVEAKLGGYTSIVNDKNADTNDDKPAARDPLDEVGDFILIAQSQMLGGTHKTQRLAEIAAAKYTRDNRCCVAVFKLVSQSNVIVDAEIVRK